MAIIPSIESLPSQPWAPGAPGKRFGDLAGARFPAQGEERAALLLVHGYAEHHGRYARQIRHLTERGVTVHAFDLPGHGRSKGSRGMVDVSGLVRPVHQGLLAVQGYARDAEVPVLVFGHSMGGLLAAAVTLRVPGAVDGLFLSSPALLVGSGYPDWYKRLGRGIARVAPGFPSAKLDLEGLSRDPMYVADYREDPLVFTGAVPTVTASTMSSFADEVRAQGGGVECATTIIHGDEDSFTEVAGSREFAMRSARAQELRGRPPLAELVEFPEGRHELFNDIDADAAYEQLDRWLGRVDGGGDADARVAP